MESQNYTQRGYSRNPFFLVHGAEAVLPVEITHEAPRIAAYDETTSTEALQDDVDALDEARDVACNTPEFTTNSKCPLCNPSQSQNHCCDSHNVVDITVIDINSK
jgi:hypothetical protein